MSYKKEDVNIQAIYKFSEAKDANDYSLGGEDGLDETPFVIENNDLTYLGSPKWSDLSIYGSKNISSNIILRLGLTNVFDTHYRTFASGISSPGRSIEIGINIEL